MTRDHLLGFPALALADEDASSDSLRYGLGAPTRIFDEMHARVDRKRDAARPILVFERGDHTPEHMRPPAAPAVGFAVGDVVRMTLRSASYCGRRATVLERSLSGTTMRVHFEGDPEPVVNDWYVVWAFERVAQ